VDALLIGTGGDRGWPEDGCSCASCMRARAAGLRRAPGQVVVDGQLTIRPAATPAPERGGARAGGPAGPDSPHRVLAVPGGWDITGPDGGRLLAAAGPGQVPEPPDGTAPYDLALLDLLTRPAQLGRLRARGLVTGRTAVAALYTDHRISSETELARRCEFWRAIAASDQQLVSGPRPAPAGPPRPHRTLVLGGARSGKSREAELRLAGEPDVTYVAAGPWAEDSWTGAGGEPDTEWAERVAAHRAARPAWWRTEETLDLAGALRRATGALLIDGIGTWLTAIIDEAGGWPDDDAGWAPSGADPQKLIEARTAELTEAWRQTRALVVAVTDQVGSGLVPPYPAGRMFRDQLGWLNQRLAAEADVSLLVVAGRTMILPA
jgi:adenosylcobinamide kinase / adenosylcobinamide-phosphate guanylyltransferase